MCLAKGKGRKMDQRTEQTAINVQEYTIQVGADKPFSVYHMSDNHICEADERDNARKQRLAERRGKEFSDCGKNAVRQLCDTMLEVVRREQLPLIHTGDLIDFVSEANLAYAKQALNGLDVMMAVGNHEFSQYVGEAFEDERCKAETKEQVLAAMPDGSLFGVQIRNGVKFITVDNGYYYILPEQLKAFEKEISEGMPTVLVMHNPLYSKDMYEQVITATGKNEPPYLMGCPEVLLRHLEGSRFRQQVADGVTLKFLACCEEAANLKAVLAGHLHKSYVSRLDSGVPQYVVDGAYHAVMNKYQFI